MYPQEHWPPQAIIQSPLFAPLLPALARLNVSAFPDLPDWNRALRAQSRIEVHSGKQLRFVAQEAGKQGFESQYEPRCFIQGEVQTRSNNWHDCFNALAWLTFPLAKAAINYRHYLALTGRQQLADENSSQRGHIRDAVTLLDETGVIVVSSDAALLEMIQQFEWKELFWNSRDRLRSCMAFFVIGHGLYEKALQPYIGMTGQGLLLHVDQPFFSMPQTGQLQEIDRRVAAYINDLHKCISTRELQPVPLLGIPGWSAESAEESFYLNAAYFRPGRKSGAKSTTAV